jgi:hypothetical protein
MKLKEIKCKSHVLIDPTLHETPADVNYVTERETPHEPDTL